jgi:hypothetical protein
MTAGSPLSRWEWRESQLSDQDTWTFIEVPLDLDGAVTMTAMLTATPARRDPGPGETASVYHERGLVWYFQDSLDVQNWFTVANGALYPGADRGVARVSSPLGTTLRLALTTSCSVATVASGEVAAFKRTPCPNPGKSYETCSVDHSTLLVTDIAVHVAVRSI